MLLGRFGRFAIIRGRNGELGMAGCDIYKRTEYEGITPSPRLDTGHDLAVKTKLVDLGAVSLACANRNNDTHP